MAQAHGPESSQILELERLIVAQPTTTAVRLRAGHNDLQVPHYIEIMHPADSRQVEDELRHWGLECVAFQFGEHEQFLCFNKDCPEENTYQHYMFCNQDLRDSQGCILHSQASELNHCDMMKLLDSLGYARAVILKEEKLPLAIHRATFCDVVPEFADKEVHNKLRSKWPQWHTNPVTSTPFFPADVLESGRPDKGAHMIHTGFSQEDLKELIQAGENFLNEDFSAFERLDLPEFVQNAIMQPRTLESFDRWLIYTDVTSQSRLRRHAPQHADALGFPDAWSMIVLGEKIIADGSTKVEPIGWYAQPVHYDPSGACFTHAERIGAEVAEREAPIWAGIWRITQNSTTPTIFCCDSLSCGNQAFGNIGVGKPDLAYRLLRGIFQCLEYGLPTEET